MGVIRRKNVERNVTLCTAFNNLYNRQVQEYGGTSHSLNDWEIINPIFFNNAWTKGYLSHWNSERSRRSGKIYKGLKVELETPFSDLNTRSCRTGNSIINTSTRRVCKVNDSRGNISYKRLKKYRSVRPEYDILPSGCLY